MSDLAILMQAVVTEFKIVPEKVLVSNEWEAAFWRIVLAALFLPLSGLFRLIDVWRPPTRLSWFEIAFMLFAS